MPIVPWISPLVSVMTGSTFQITRSCTLRVAMLGKILTGRCGVLPRFPVDLLLGMDFLRVSEFWIDLGTMQLADPRSEHPSISLYLLPRCSLVCDATGIGITLEEPTSEEPSDIPVPGQLRELKVSRCGPDKSKGALRDAVLEETPLHPVD